MAAQSNEINSVEQQHPVSYPTDTKSATGHNTQQYQQNGAQQNIQPPQQAHMQYGESKGPTSNYGQPGPHMVTPLNGLSNISQQIDCPHCRQVTVTRVEEHSSTMTILFGFVAAFFCFCLFCIPFAAKMAYDTTWFCNTCGCKLAIQNHDQPINVTYGNPFFPPPGPQPIPKQP